MAIKGVGETRWHWRGLLVPALLLACGPDREFRSDGNAGGAGGAESGGGTAEGGAGADLPPCNDDGARRCSGAVTQTCSKGFWRDLAVCTSGCTGEGVCSCAAGARQCERDTPQMCLNSAWVDEPSCDGVSEVCTGAGVCASFRLLDAGIVTVQSPAGGAGSALKKHTLSVGHRICGPNYCMSGEIQ